MKRLGHLLIGFLVSANLTAQPSALSTGAYGGNFAGPPMFLKDVFSRPLKSVPYSDVEGTPFLTTDLLWARIVVEDDKWIDSIKVRLNLYTNKVHFIGEGGEEMTLSMKVKQVKIIQSGSSYFNNVFLMELPGDKKRFFQVVTEGEVVNVLRKLVISQWQVNTFGDGLRKQFKEEFEFAYLFNDQLVNQSRDCGNFPVKYNSDGKLREYIQTNQLRCNKMMDMMKIAAYINENYSK